MTVLTCLWFCFWRRLSDDNRAFLGSGPYLNRDGIASSLKCFRTFSPISCARKSISKQLSKKCSLQTWLFSRGYMVLRELVVTHGFSRLFWVIVAVRHNAADHFLLCLIQTVKKGWTGSHGHNAKGRNKKTFCPSSSNIRISREPFANQPRTIDVPTSQRTADHCNAARILPKMAEY